MKAFTELYDLFEREYFSDLAALTNIAKRISGNTGILIDFNQNSNLACTNGRFIYLPRKFRDEVKESRGLVAHESGHIGYGSFELFFLKLVSTFSKKYSLPNFLVKQIVNVIEDVRINELNNKKFPGFAKNLKDFTLKLLPEIILKMKRSGNILIYINLYMEGYQEFQSKPKFRSRIMSDADWNAISTTKTFLLQTLTPASSILSIDQLCKVLKKYIVKKRVRRVITPHPTYNPNRYVDYDDESYLEKDIEKFIEISEENRDLYYKFREEEDYSDTDFLEDPCYYDYEEGAVGIGENTPHNMIEPLINHSEEFVDNTKKEDSLSELEVSSDKIIETLKDNDITIDDIENLIEQTDNVNQDIEEITDFDKKGSLDPEKIQDLVDNIDSEVQNKEKIPKPDLDPELKITIDLDKSALENAIFLQIHDSNNEPNEKESSLIEKLMELVTESQNAMEERLIFIEDNSLSDRSPRKVKEVFIENEKMKPINLSYRDITRTYRNYISKLKRIFQEFQNHSNVDTFQKRGRLNNKLIKAVTSEFKYNKCFTRKIHQKELKILLMVDISGSMESKRLEPAKIAMILLSEALYGIAQLRIVLFAGAFDAINIQMKNFNEKPDPKKFDKFGCHQDIKCNLDGVSIKYEAESMEKNVIIIVISDGQPSGTRYGLNDAIKEIHDVRKLFNVFAFSIDAKGEHLNKLYGKNWILTDSSNQIDLGEKLVKFCKLVSKEYFR